jgi:hypothetical protein
MRLPYSLVIEPFIYRSGGGVGVIANVPNTSLPGRYGSLYTTVASSTAVEGRYFAIYDKFQHDTVTVPSSITIFRLEADTSQPTLKQVELRRLSRPWVDLYRKYQQTKKNASAIALIESWLKEAETTDEAETRNFEEMKLSLDAHRSSARKLFP